MNISSVSFRGDIIYKDRYIPDKADNTHDIIRAHFENELDPYFFYLDQIAKEKEMLTNRGFSVRSLPYTTKTTTQHKTTKKEVDVELLKKLKISAFRERRANELYSGAQLTDCSSKLDEIKKAGIKSVYSLVPSDEYKAEVEKRGMHYHSLIQSELSIFDINGDVMEKLINNPKSFVNEENDPKIQGIKDFVKTLNGDNPQMPLPMYFGCHYGTDRTYFWHRLYTILKDVDMEKPLPDDKVQELAEFMQDVDDHFRW